MACAVPEVYSRRRASVKGLYLDRISAVSRLYLHAWRVGEDDGDGHDGEGHVGKQEDIELLMVDGLVLVHQLKVGARDRSGWVVHEQSDASDPRSERVGEVVETGELGVYVE